jgi:ankyrin repeat protein
MANNNNGSAAEIDSEAIARFRSIWEDAVIKYEEDTQRDLAGLVRDKDVRTVDTFYNFLEKQDDRRKIHRGKHQKTRDVLQRCVLPIIALSDVAKSSLSLTPFAPAATIFGAGMFLINACGDVTTAYDCVEELLMECQQFTERLRQYITEHMNKHQLEKVTRILCFLLEVLAQCDQEISMSRRKKFFDGIFGTKNELLKKNVAKLNKHFEHEEQFNIAQIYVNSLVIKSDVGKIVRRQDEELRNHHQANLRKSIDSIPLGPIDIAAKQADEVRKSRSSPPDWIYREKTFESWLSGTTYEERWLWGFGKPGTGKTSLVSYLTQAWQSDPEVVDCDESCRHEVMGVSGDTVISLQRSAVALFYCSYRHRDEQSPDAVFQSLCRQLLDQLRVVDINRAHSRVEELNPPPDEATSTTDWTNMLDNLISEFQRTFIVIDALDENETGYGELVSRLAQLTSPSLKLLVTSHEGRSAGADAEAYKALQLPIRAKKEFVKSYVDARLSRIAKYDDLVGGSALPEVLREGRQQEIVDKVAEGASGDFYHAELQIAALKGGVTKEDIQEVIRNLAAKSFTDMVRGIIDRITGQEDPDKRDIGIKTLMWCIYARRTLTIEELRHAVALTIRPYAREDQTGLQIEVGKLSKEVLVESTRYFLQADDTNSQVQINDAFKDYCDQVNMFENAHYDMAETCLAFLDHRFFSLRSTSEEEFLMRQKEYPFYDYAAKNWAIHMKRAGEERFLAPSSPICMLSLLNRRLFLNCIAVAIREDLQRIRMWSWYGVDPWKALKDTSKSVLQPVHLLTYFDLPRTLGWWLRQHPQDVNRRSLTGTTPLYIACCLQRIRVAETLIFDFQADVVEKGAPPSGFNLSAAVNSQSTELVERLLYVNAEKLVQQGNLHGHQPLAEAAMRENVEVVRLIVQAIESLSTGEKILTNQKSKDHWNALHDAAGAANPNPKVMKILVRARGGSKLLQQRTWKWQNTPLHVAAAKGQQVAVQTLLDLGADPMARQASGQTALHTAVQGVFAKNEEVIKTLMKVTDLVTQDDEGYTTWHFAAQNGRPRILRLLIENSPKMLFNVKNKYNAIPIRTAIENKHSGWIQCALTLLELCFDELKIEDAYAVFDCLIHEHKDVSEAALTQLFKKPINQWSLERGNTTILHQVVHHGTLAMVKIVWKSLGSCEPPRTDEVINYRDPTGATPLVLAMKMNDHDKAEFLINAGADLNAQDHTGRTALHYAIERDMPDLAGMVLDRHADHRIKDNSGISALERASAQNLCNKIWQVRAVQRTHAGRALHELVSVNRAQKLHVVSHVESRTKLLGQSVAANAVGIGRIEYLRSDPISPLAKLPILRIDVSLTWSFLPENINAEGWFDLAIIRGDQVEQQDMFCHRCVRQEGQDRSGTRTHSASWHVEKGLVGAVGDSESYGSRGDEQQQQIIDFVKSVRIGDRLALVAITGTQETVLVCEEAQLKVYYED